MDTHLSNRAVSGHLDRKLHYIAYWMQLRWNVCMYVKSLAKKLSIERQLVQRGVVDNDGSWQAACGVYIGMWHTVNYSGVTQCDNVWRMIRFWGFAGKCHNFRWRHLFTLSQFLSQRWGGLVTRCDQWAVSNVCTGEQVASCYTRNSAMSCHCQWRGLSCPVTRARSSYSKYFYSCIFDIA